MRRYYEAYDDRYRQAHAAGLAWFTQQASQIVLQTVHKLGLNGNSRMLELGCGEGRDAKALLACGYDLMASDVSPEAIAHCRKMLPQHAERFFVLDAVEQQPKETYDFVYAIAVLHMLVEEDDRLAFLRFVCGSLKEGGTALLCMLGDGTVQRAGDVSTAFDLQERTHWQTGRTLCVAGTSCRIVDRETLRGELDAAGLEIAEAGMTVIEEYAIPDFLPEMMYVLVKSCAK